MYIVDKQHILEVSVNDPKILNVEALLTAPATVPEVPMRDIVLGVKVVNYHVGIALVTSSKDYELELTRQLL